MQVSDTPAIWADFVHIRTVKGRKVCEIILETALEDLLEVLKRLGNPVGADSISVAIVPLDPKKVAQHLDVKTGKELARGPATPQAVNANGKREGSDSAATSSSEAQRSGSKKFHELPLSQQAAIRCGDILFQEYMKADGPVDCADLVRAHCGIQSRAELDNQDPSWLPSQHWRILESRYQAWATDRKFAEAKR